MPIAPKPFRTNLIKGQPFNAPPRRGKTAERGYDSRWQRISRLYRRLHPECQWPDCDELAECVDHIRPFHGMNDPLRTDMDNLQSLCWHHHSVKTAKHDGGFGHAKR